MPTALMRSSFGWATVSSDSVAGMTKAAPTPATTLPTMICSGLCNIAGASEPRAKTTKPMSNAPRLP